MTTNSFEDSVPPHEPAEDAFVLAARAGLALIPGVGGLAGDVWAHSLDTRDKRQRHDYDIKVARALDLLVKRDRDAPSVDDIIASDEFLAAINFTRRVASETVSEAKRERLAQAAASSGPWSDFTSSERSGYLRLVAKYDELHIWLLAYFADPVAWLDAHELTHVHEDVTAAEMGTQIAWALDVGFGDERSPDDVPAVVQDALEDLAMDSVLSPILLQTIRDRPFAGQATSRGRRLLAYLRETPISVPVPSDL